MTEATFSGTVCGYARAAQVYSKLRRTPPATRRDLKNYVKVFLGMDVPDKRICEGHSSPMDYLWDRFSVDLRRAPDQRGSRATNDIIVWANRAGGKTELAAVA